jgi:hypothetical protein
MAFVISVDRRQGKPPFRLRIGHIFEIGFLIPRTSHILILREIEHELHSLIRGDVSEERIIQLAHRVERLHEHVCVGDFAGQKVVQSLLGPFVIAGLKERLVSLSGARFSRNVRPKVADNVAALLDVGGRPTAALTIQEVRAATLDLEQWSVVNGRLVAIGKQLLMTRGALTTFSIANDVAKYFAIVPAMFAGTLPWLKAIDVMHLHSPTSAILSAVIFNALIIPLLIPIALKGVRYQPLGADALLRRNLLIWGLGGVIVPFIGIKAIDLVMVGLHFVA